MTLAEELEQAATVLDAARMTGHAKMLRLRADVIRSLEALWKRERYQYGAPPCTRQEASAALAVLHRLCGDLGAKP